MARKPRVLVIGTGGTMGAKLVDGIWKYGEITMETLVNSTPRVKEHFEVSTTNLFRMDSADMKPDNWLTLANTIYYAMNDYDGIVVTIGSDTAAYAATAVSFLIQELNIPVVFTSALMHPEQLNTDAEVNLRDAITVAGRADIAETLIVFNGKIMRATRTKKVNASELGGFGSFETSYPLGDIQQFISLNTPYRKRSRSKPKLYNKLETDVATVKVYPGFDGNRIKNLVDYPVKGMVLEGFGLGNIPVLDNGMKEAIAYANSKNAAVVIASNCYLGKHWQRIYEAEIGNRLRGLRAIPVYDMLPETAYVKLMWVLAQTTDYKKVKSMMQKSYAGEITPFSKNKIDTMK
ncbi:MAG: asparaginase [Candidatus Diapherotrites archaeon]|uniref:Asparaginase n=1 Tax=Candidatus Iainarchaeum sp. TaxID=3101447 RepID=A0A8T3YM81_9ARCH|nr:asparaginase [Candidatus Diapherotrites archaeon]